MEPVLHVIQMVRRFAAVVLSRFQENRCAENAAALTYTTLFAVVPMMTVTYSMLSAIPSLNGVSDTVQNFIFENFVPATGAVVQSYLSDFSQQARKLTGVGVAFLLVTSFMMLRTIDGALNKIWQVDQVRRGVSGFLLYWAILSLGPLLLGAGFILTSYLASLKLVSDTTAFVGGWLGVERWLLRLMPFLLSTLVFTLLYVAVPNRKVPVRHGLIGAVFVAFLVELAKAGFALFISLSPSYQLIYGAFAAVPLFLLWIYLSWLLVLLGAVIVRSLALYGGSASGERLHPLVSLLTILKAFQVRFQEGKGLTYARLLSMENAISLDDWEQYTVRLMHMGMISKNESGDWMLARDLRQVSLVAFCGQLPWPLPDDKALESFASGHSPGWLSELAERIKTINRSKSEVLEGSLDQLLSR